MENVKLPCSTAATLTRADCGVTPVTLPTPTPPPPSPEPGCESNLLAKMCCVFFGGCLFTL